jgi:hypothetical protein
MSAIIKQILEGSAGRAADVMGVGRAAGELVDYAGRGGASGIQAAGAFFRPPATAGFGFAGNLSAIGVGAASGALGSYWNDGSVAQGAFVGVLGGYGAARMARGARSAGRYVAQNSRSQGWASAGQNVHSIASMITRRRNRTVAFGSGAMLSGMAFGGNGNNHRRGFNANRGSYIGHA